MEKIVLYKQGNGDIRKNGVLIRISPEVNQQLEALSEETGIAKTRIADCLLKKVLKNVVVEDEI